MHLLPLLLSTWWGDFGHPHRAVDRNLALAGFNPGDSVLSRHFDRYYPNSRDQMAFYYRPWMDVMRRVDGATTTMGIASDEDNFKVVIDVRQFKPEEISVKVVNRCVVIEAKHEEKGDQHGRVSRQFVRKYLLPDRADLDQVSSTISSDGILTVTVPLKKEPEEPEERVIEIQRIDGKVDEEEGRSVGTEETLEDNEIREESTTRRQEEEEVEEEEEKMKPEK